MAFNVNLFQGALKFGGARNSLFQVTISNPANPIGDIQVPFLTKNAQIPESVETEIELHYFGRPIKVAGNRTYAAWETTIINDEDFAIRHGLEQWMDQINSAESNLRSFGSASPLLYKSQAQVTQFSKTGVPIRVYEFVGVWPSTIGAIELAWEADTVEEYPVTFTYDYWRVVGGVTGTVG